MTQPPHATIPSACVSTGCRGRHGSRRSVPVVAAYILVQTKVGKAAQVAKDIAEIKGVQLAEDVTGPYDVIVRAEARNLDELGKLVVARVQAVDGITRTHLSGGRSASTRASPGSDLAPDTRCRSR